MLVDLRFRFSKCVIEIKCHDTQSCVHLLPSVRIQAIYRLGYFFIAYDTERTVAEARALWWLVDRPNLFVKIPAARQRHAVPDLTVCGAAEAAILGLHAVASAGAATADCPVSEERHVSASAWYLPRSAPDRLVALIVTGKPGPGWRLLLNGSTSPTSMPGKFR